MAKKLSEMSLEELWNLFPICLTEHRDIWAAWYEQERDFLSRILPGWAELRVNHIGSTAISGIWAKPIVDLLIEAPDAAALKAVKERMTTAGGYICMAEAGDRISLNKGYGETGFAEKVYHAHLRLRGDDDEIYFRDYLNAYPEIAKEYEKLKLSLWKTYERDRDAYTDAKTEFVAHYTALAKESGIHT